jgi:hypothetical protein
MRLIPTALALGLACGSAFAQQAVETPAIEPGTLTAYTEYDVNGDGTITTDEFVSLVPPQAQTAARNCDSGGKGNLSQAEYNACAGLGADDGTQRRF